MLWQNHGVVRIMAGRLPLTLSRTLSHTLSSPPDPEAWLLTPDSGLLTTPENE